MSSHLAKQLAHNRDGTSQQSRIKAALDPDYVAVDERSLKDLLAFVQSYAGELKYFDENNQESGTWQAFFPEDIDLDELQAFIKDPESIPESRANVYRRPHFVLLLSFLQLLGHAQEHINTLTKRHLDFYFQQFLQMRKKPAQADYINVMIELAKHQEYYHLPAGTLLNAGKDSTGRVLAYKTERNTQLSHAQITKLSSLHADKRVIGIREAREYHLIANPNGAENQAFLEMMRIALGAPAPGDSLPLYESNVVDYLFLMTLKNIVDFIPDKLNLLFADFANLMKYKYQRTPTNSPQHSELRRKHGEDWKEINRIIEKAGFERARIKNETFNYNPVDKTDFNTNFMQALKIDPYEALSFSGLEGVDNLNDLHSSRTNSDVIAFITNSEDNNLSNSLFMPLTDFDELMNIKIPIDAQWEQINTLLETASGKTIQDNTDSPPNFEDKLEETLKPDFSVLTDIDNIDDLHNAILKIQTYFHMSALDFSYLMHVANKADSDLDDWGKIYTLLTTAYQQKLFTHRQAELEAVRSSTQGHDAIQLMAALVLARSKQEQIDLSELQFFISQDNFDYLTKIDNDSEPTPDWQRVYRFLANAWNNREGAKQVPEKTEWQNLYVFEDASSAKISLEQETGNAVQRWDTFGRSPENIEKSAQALAEFGWAISSPILLLGQGKRTITLTLSYQVEQFNTEKIAKLLIDSKDNQEKLPFQIVASSEEGWVEPSEIELIPTQVENDSPDSPLPALKFTIIYEPDAVAITAPTVDFSPPSEWPIVKVILRQIRQSEDILNNSATYFTHYQAFQHLILADIQIDVQVEGLSDILIQNDNKTLDAAKPFEPFGTKPIIGSRFYIAHAELAFKKLSSLEFIPEWSNVPDPIQGHYVNYTEITPATTFNTNISIQNKKLSASLIKSEKKSLLTESLSIKEIQPSDKFTYDIDFYPETSASANEWNRYIQWELNSPDFQHTNYPALVAKKATLLAADIANKKTITEQDYLVNPPYTPLVKKLTVNYSSSQLIEVNSFKATNRTAQLFHIHPFGYSRMQEQNKQPCYFLPQFDNEGELYIGIEKLKPPENLSLLFQMAEGSANADLEPGTVHWSYLSANQWLSLDGGNMLNDTTRGLINSGIIELSLPIAKANTLLSPDLFWLRVSIAKNSNSVCDTVAIHTQAISASFVNNNNAPDHFSQPLPADTVKQLLPPSKAVKAIHQPYTSYGGKISEQDDIFYTRVSERLRHKNRALTQWDYEHILLEHFPQIYKAKCLPARLRKYDDKPGSVEVIVIPDIHSRLPFDPFEPKVPADLIADIETYLQDKAPACACITVSNASYIPLKIRLGVRFHPGYNEAYYKKILNDELNQFLSPWAYGKGADIVIGGKIYANSIINFAEQRPYIDYVAEIKMFKGSTFQYVEPTSKDGYSVEADHPGSVLVAARQHDFDLISEFGYEEDLFIGINYMKIELDFQVANEQ
ncbi:MAG: hypothetical protein DRQ62_00280 [Gammaproteobacteria bacterium]|nr:MAG: hypothetical protein DRQ62_00280 [Gammaproteobacteria bacterium]